MIEETDDGWMEGWVVGGMKDSSLKENADC